MRTNDGKSTANEGTLEILKRLGVLRTGHFRLTSGRHSDRYMQCAKLFEHPDESAELCGRLADAFAEKLGARGRRVDAVAGPALGGIIMAYETARALGARGIFAERENGAMTLRRGFKVEPGERVLVVEDVVTTGGSVKEVIGLLQDMGADVAGVGTMVDRSGGAVDFGVEFIPLLAVDIASWDERDCELCRGGVPIVKPGSRDPSKG
ncbi:MAG: orotate phosphoribosyltransferase [Synergistaceae bacterium]|jgi:orotate phosphoribosyltransferase|nr:orotate phosphoribosyltransferase [Synergistaceae bacterium]